MPTTNRRHQTRIGFRVQARGHDDGAAIGHRTPLRDGARGEIVFGEADLQGVRADHQLITLVQGSTLTRAHGLLVQPDGVGIANIEDAVAIGALHHFGLQARDAALWVRQRQGIGVGTTNGAAPLIEVGRNGLGQGLARQTDGSDQQMHESSTLMPRWCRHP